MHDLHNDLRFLPERIKIEKVEKLVENLHDKEAYVIRIRNLKQPLNHGLISTKSHRVITFNQKSWLKPYIDVNTEIRTNSKNDLERNNFYKVFMIKIFTKKFMDNAAFGKTMEHVRKHRDIRPVTIEARSNSLVSEPNYHTTKCFSENLLATEIKETQIFMNKPALLHLLVIEVQLIVMYEFWYDSRKPK